MEVSQIVQLSDWLEKNLRAALTVSQSRIAGIMLSSQQQLEPQPVTELLKELSRALANMQTSELSRLQFGVLEKMDVAYLVGDQGAAWINQQVEEMTSPTATFQAVFQGLNELESALHRLNRFKISASKIGFQYTNEVDALASCVFNVVFQKGTSIKNVRDWKQSASNWEFIISSVAAVVDERPEDISVVGTQNGSIILTLSATPIFTKILATVSKHIASIINDQLDFQLKREELRRSRMMTDVIEKEFAKMEVDRNSTQIKKILAAVKNSFDKQDPEAIAKLEGAVDRLIKFFTEGGEVEFVSLPNLNKKGKEYDKDFATIVDDLKKLIYNNRLGINRLYLLPLDVDSESKNDGD